MGNALNETILIVDDEPHIRRILKFLLEQQGYAVLDAADGEQGIEIARREPIDLVLLDLMMPRMDGFEVVRALRADFATSQIPVIMVTAKGEVLDKIKGLQGGANDYLTKPYDNKELLARVRNVLDWSRAQRQANPLTGLPGNQAIESELQERMAQDEPFSFLYLDIDNFKGFNDHYGYQRGDEGIRLLARLLRAVAAEVGSGRDFIGHIGGDDFCVVSTPEEGGVLADRLVERFDEAILELVDEEDRERGYLLGHDRTGGEAQVPFPSLTVALVSEPGGRFEHWAQVSDVAAEVKAYGKSKAGSLVVRDRRHGDGQSGPNAPLTGAEPGQG